MKIVEFFLFFVRAHTTEFIFGCYHVVKLRKNNIFSLKAFVLEEIAFEYLSSALKFGLIPDWMGANNRGGTPRARISGKRRIKFFIWRFVFQKIKFEDSSSTRVLSEFFVEHV